MNIVVFSSDSNVFVRPDTTWERDNEDLYVPEFINTISWTPVLFARISKPGRSISSKFASRYYDSIGYGVLLYPEDLISKSPEGFASACCVDHTSFLTFPTYPPTRLDGQQSRFELSKNGTPLFSYDKGSRRMIESAMEEVSKYCYLRIGDILAIEIGRRGTLCKREDGWCRITGTFGEDSILDFKTIF